MLSLGQVADNIILPALVLLMKCVCKYLLEVRMGFMVNILTSDLKMLSSPNPSISRFILNRPEGEPASFQLFQNPKPVSMTEGSAQPFYPLRIKV